VQNEKNSLIAKKKSFAGLASGLEFDLMLLSPVKTYIVR
jgi:hypothetical protein